MKYSRRKFLKVATGSTLSFLAFPFSAEGKLRFRKISALGNYVSLEFFAGSEKEADKITSLCFSEIERLENLFSLYRNSSLTRLNQQGFLLNPPKELVEILRMGLRYGDLSGGAFDITVQPLWNLFASHFSFQKKHKISPFCFFSENSSEEFSPPSQERIEKMKELINYRDISLSEKKIEFGKKGMAITLNGMAQGYITDKVGDFLAREGYRDFLINVGEIASRGTNFGAPWKIGIPKKGRRNLEVVILNNQAISTSSGKGTVFDSKGTHHHLLDIAEGRSSHRYSRVSVIAPRAVDADALSTAIYVMEEQKIEKMINSIEGASIFLLERNQS